MNEETEQFQKEVRFRPAFDKRDPDPKKNYGIHGVDIVFILKGEHGAAQFVLSTGWHLPNVHEELKAKCNPADPYDYFTGGPGATDIGYHSPKPIYEGQEPIDLDCDVLEGQCFYDGSTLNARPILERLIEEGHEAVWEELKSYYNYTFHGSEETKDDDKGL